MSEESEFYISCILRPYNANFLVQAVIALAIPFTKWDAKSNPAYMEDDVGLTIYTRSRIEVGQFWEMHQQVLEDLSDIPGLGGILG